MGSRAGLFHQLRPTEQAARLKCFLNMENIEIAKSVLKDVTESVFSSICIACALRPTPQAVGFSHAKGGGGGGEGALSFGVGEINCSQGIRP